ncbi:MAG: deaminase [Cocleimonas sp.]|nr:deaminase [Cocleimonas sp.]
MGKATENIKRTKPKAVELKKSASSTRELLKTRESKELILGFSGAVGCGIDLALDTTKQILESNGYTVEIIKLSRIISDLDHKEELSIKHNPPVDRFMTLQSAGNALREKYGNDILAELATSKITEKRTSTIPNNEDIESHVPEKTAYLIDQLKHPEEVEFLWSVYGKLFVMIGVLASYNLRKSHLKSSGINVSDAEKIIDRDRKEDEKHGQQLDKTLLFADFFVRNNLSSSHTTDQVERLIKLIHGANGITPSQHEYAMYVAYSAGLRSACMSRQVGAAITDKKGNILATGCNDVPKAGGGLYNESDKKEDYRCVNFRDSKCSNDVYKNTLKDNIKNILINEATISNDVAEKLVESISKNTRLKDLIEFSRSVHAEMDALTSIARTGGIATQKGLLYTTTFPCHNCARHIVAAGIKKVFYIEPYEKSLALELHGDSIDIETDDSSKLQIIHFEGVAPRRYLHFFTPKGERKDNSGNAIRIPVRDSTKKNFEYLDSYRVLEMKVVKQLAEAGLIENPDASK